MGVSDNSGTPKSSILIGFSIINHPFLGTLILGNTHILVYKGPFTNLPKIVICKAGSHPLPESAGGIGSSWKSWAGQKRGGFQRIPYPIGSMYGISTCIWMISMVNVGKYTIHGSYGYGKGSGS